MLTPGHLQAAEDKEQVIKDLQGKAFGSSVVIECCWGAGFHYIAAACQTRYGQHHDSHAKMGSYLRQLGEPTIATAWEQLDNARQGGWYGQHADPTDVQKALTLLSEIRTWAQP
jgi:hypothetical protein